MTYWSLLDILAATSGARFLILWAGMSLMLFPRLTGATIAILAAVHMAVK